MAQDHRYTNRQTFSNGLEMYNEQLTSRRANQIVHYSTSDMTYPNQKEMRNIQTVSHIWKQGDRYYKLAHKYYGESKLWWVIAWFNKKPTETHLETGDTVRIPLPLEAALSFMRSR